MVYFRYKRLSLVDRATNAWDTVFPENNYFDESFIERLKAAPKVFKRREKQEQLPSFKLEQGIGNVDPIKVRITDSSKTERPRCIVHDGMYIRADTVTSVSISGSDVILTLGSGEVPLVECNTVEEAEKTKNQIVKYVFGDRLYIGQDASALAEVGA